MIWPTISPAREIAHQPLRTGVAERTMSACSRPARKRTACPCLSRGCRRTRPRAPFRRCVAARQAQQPFAGAVIGNLLGDDLGPVDREMLGQLRRASLSRCSTYQSKSLRAADIHPVPKLLRAHLALRRARRRSRTKLFGDLRARQPDQRRLGRRNVGFQRGLFERRRESGEGHGITQEMLIVTDGQSVMRAPLQAIAAWARRKRLCATNIRHITRDCEVRKLQRGLPSAILRKFDPAPVPAPSARRYPTTRCPWRRRP